MPLEVRPARPEDAPAISRIHRGSVERWYRYPQEGPPVPAPPEELSPVDLWRNGGPWMLPELCWRHLTWLLGGAGYVWVGLLEGKIVGEAEAFLSREPPPLGRYLNLSVLYVHRRAQRRGVGSALVEQLLTQAATEGGDALLIGQVEAPAFYARHGFVPWRTMVRAWADCPPATAAGRPFEPGDYGQVAGLPMPVGRYQSSREEWTSARGPEVLPEGLPPHRRDWRALETPAGPAWTVFTAEVGEPGRAEVRAWSQARPEDLLPCLLAAGGALGYRQVSLLLEEEPFLRLAERCRLIERDRHQAWWRPLRARE